MDISIISTLVDAGVAGAMLLFFIWYVNSKDKAHDLERKEWQAIQVNNSKILIDVIEKNTRAITTMQETLRDAECKYFNNYNLNNDESGTT